MAELNKETLADLVDLSRATGLPRVAEGANVPYAVIPQTCQIVDLSKFVFNEHSSRPERVKGTAKVLDAQSFCDYYTLFHDDHSRVFADETQNKIVAVLDYHEVQLEGGGAGPRWGSHRLDLTMRPSKEWLIWKAADGKKQSQMEFAEFIEDNTPDIIAPPAAAMLEVARDLSAKTDVDFGSAVRMQDGSVRFRYSESVKATVGAGNIDVPEQFDIAVPIYIGTDRVRITARLRYRINSSKLTFWYNLLRADAAEREAFQMVRTGIADSLGVTIINGSPA